MTIQTVNSKVIYIVGGLVRGLERWQHSVHIDKCDQRDSGDGILALSWHWSSSCGWSNCETCKYCNCIHYTSGPFGIILINENLPLYSSNLWVFFVNVYLKLLLPEAFFSSKCTKYCLGPGSAQTYWWSLQRSPRPHIWIKGSLLLREVVWEESGGREGKGNGKGV